MSDKTWLHPKPYQENDEMTIFIEMNITSTFTSTHRHGAFVALFSVAIISEVIVFMIAGVVYVHMQIKYNNAQQAKQYKITK